MPIDNSDGGGWHGIPGLEGGKAFFEINNTVTAFDINSGKVIWRTAVKSVPAPSASNIVVRDGRIFLAESSEALALDAASGAILWRFTPDAQASLGESAVDDRALYIGTRSHRVYALDIRTGQQLWSTDIGPDWQYFGLVSGVTVAGDTIYAGAVRYLNQAGGISAGVIAALDRRDGHILWKYQGPGTGQNDINSSPAISGRLLVASDLGGAFFAVDRFTAQEVWRVSAPPGYFGPSAAPVIVDDRVYVGSNDKYVYAADLTTGNVVWKTDTGASINAFSICNNTAFAQNQGIYVLERNTGRVRAKLYTESETEFPTSGFAVAADRVLVSGTQAVYAIACGA